MEISKLTKARTQLVLDYPFWSCLLMKYPMKAREDIPTLAVDRRGQIYYNEKFIESLGVKQIIWGICHELGHMIGCHAQRMHHRNPKKWNYAGDAWINDWLTADQVGHPIPGCVDMPGSRNELIENIYNKLPDSPDGGGGQGQSIGGIGDDLLPEGEPMSKEEAAAAEAEMKVAVAQAANVAKMKGKMSAHMKQIVDDIINVKTPWYDILERFMTSKVKNDSSWNRPNRRFIGQDLYLPSLDSVGAMDSVAIQIDESGSIGTEELNYFAGHMNKILEQCRPAKVYVIHTDSVVSCVEEFTADQYPITLERRGGGGTDMREGFNWLLENGVTPAAMVTLTDGYTPYPESVPFPTIWAMTTDQVAPAEAGETVNVEVAHG